MVKVEADLVDEQKHSDEFLQGGLKGAGLGLSIAVLASLALQNTKFPAFAAYRQLTLPLKAFAVTSVTTAAFIISADSASRKFELSKYARGSGGDIEASAWQAVDLEEKLGLGERKAVNSSELSTRDAVVEWSRKNKYSVILGGWIASMAGSFAYISTTPLSFSQKLVQARMSAQGLTVLVLIASAGLSSIPTASGSELDEERERQVREASNYKWKKGSPHFTAEVAAHKAEALAEAAAHKAEVEENK